MIRFLLLSAVIACSVAAQGPERAEEELNEAQSRLRAMLKQLQDAPRGVLPGFVPPAAPDPQRLLQMQLEQQTEVNRRLREMFEKNKEMTDDQRVAFEKAMKIREDNLKTKLEMMKVATPRSGEYFPGMPNLKSLGLLPMKPAKEQDPGLQVRVAVPASPAALAGMKGGDVLLEVDGKKVPGDVFAFEKMLNAFKDDVPFQATVLRAGRTETVAGIRFPKFVGPRHEGELAVSGLSDFQIDAARYSEVRGVFKGKYSITPRGVSVASGAYSLFAVTVAGRIGVDAVRNKDGVKVECVTLQRFGRATTYTGTDDLPKEIAAIVDDLLGSVR